MQMRRVEGRSAIITGPTTLRSSYCSCIRSSCRCSARTCRFIAEGETEIQEIHHIERGYSSLIEKLQGLGADIRKVNNFERSQSIAANKLTNSRYDYVIIKMCSNVT